MRSELLFPQGEFTLVPQVPAVACAGASGASSSLHRAGNVESALPWYSAKGSCPKRNRDSAGMLRKLFGIQKRDQRLRGLDDSQPLQLGRRIGSNEMIGRFATLESEVWQRPRHMILHVPRWSQARAKLKTGEASGMVVPKSTFVDQKR